MSSLDNARLRASNPAERRRDDRGRRSQVIRQLMLLVGAGLVVAAGAQPAAAAEWSIQPVPLPAHSGDSSLSGVSCTSTRDCIAVGDATVLSTDSALPLAEHWNGATWSIERTAPALSDGGGELLGVSCTSSTACIAVGSSAWNGPLAERWNGVSWSLQRPTNPPGAVRLDGVSCASSTECVAVGDGDAQFAERWSGRHWTTQNTRFDYSPLAQAGLLGVSCPSQTTCAAVGSDDIGFCTADPNVYGSPFDPYEVPLLGFWTSGRWSLKRRPNIACAARSASSPGGGLDAVSCTSETACTAVGSQIYRWNGSRWSMQSAPIGADSPSGVSCASAIACTAVGSNIYTWTGHGWSVLPIPSPARAHDVTLSGVSCVSPDSCVAVGYYASRAEQYFPLIVSIGMGADAAWER